MTEPCADRCPILADALADLARARGTTERTERVARGLSPDFVPPVPRVTTSAATRWLDQIESD